MNNKKCTRAPISKQILLQSEPVFIESEVEFVQQVVHSVF